MQPPFLVCLILNLQESMLFTTNILILLAYSSLACNSSLFTLRQLMRLAIPIGYNFLTLTKVEKAAFYTVMGPVKYVNFMGEEFNKWVFPICLFLMVFLTAFNIYGK